MNTMFRRTLVATALALATAPALAGTPESPFTRTVFFGDSLTDGGFFRSLLPANVQSVTGQFTTNPGYVWSQYLADYYGGDASVAWKATGTATPAPGTGDNWAVGGARNGVDSVGALGYTPSLASQYAAYRAAGNAVDPNALYTVWGGANDLFAVQANPAQAQQIIGSAVTAQVGLIGALTQAGAQYILVPTIPDIGLTPMSRAGGATAMAQGTALANSYNNALFGALAQSNLRVIPVDTFHFLQEVVANPAEFGIANVSGTACQPQVTAQSLTCNPSSYATSDAQTRYLFADGVHPTSGAHKAVADLAISVIDGPRQIAVLPHSAAMVGRARAQMVEGALLGAGSEDGMYWWGNLRGEQQRFNDSHGFDGEGVTGSVGVSWRSGQLVYGGFLGHGQQDIDFGARRGDFRQTDTSVGAYLGWQGEGGGWANAQVSWTRLGFEVERQVNLGQAIRYHRGTPDGDNLSVGGSAGWTFGDGAFRHGPVIGLLAQKISVDGYEEDSTLSSALAFPGQDRDSLIGSAGWQMSYAINEHLAPYARVTWDRQFEDAPEHAWAQLRSMPSAQPYAVPGLDFDDTYGTLSYGVRSRLGGFDITTGSSLTVGQKGGHDSSVFLNVGGRF